MTDIHAAFSDFYLNLWSVACPIYTNGIVDISLPQVPTEFVFSLIAPISQDEAWLVIGSMPSEKVPGHDSFHS